MEVVHPSVARRGAYIDTFETKGAAEKHAESLQKILDATNCRRQLALTYVLGKPGQKRTKWQLFLLP